jgi:hypothetical protein
VSFGTTKGHEIIYHILLVQLTSSKVHYVLIKEPLVVASLQSVMFIRERSLTASNLNFNFTLLICYRLTSASYVMSCFDRTVIPHTCDLFMLFCGLSLTKEHILIMYTKEVLKVRWHCNRGTRCLLNLAAQAFCAI